MNKQEALEALLAQMRTWETPEAEVPARRDEWVFTKMRDAVAAVWAGDLSAEGIKENLVTVGAAALYLLRDEVEVLVPGQLTLDLDEAIARWTAEGGAGGGNGAGAG